MDLGICPVCKLKIPIDATTCPYCRTSVSGKVIPLNSLRLKTGIVLLTLIGIGALVLLICELTIFRH